jgi:hypothetical protein
MRGTAGRSPGRPRKQEARRLLCDQGRFDDMPVLADALQEAGCDNEAVLTHCHEHGSIHGPGCWVLGLILENANS